MRPLRIAVQLHPQHGAYDALRRAVTGRGRRRRPPLYVGSLLPALRRPRRRTSSAGRCSPPGPSRRPAWSWARSSAATRTAIRSCSRTWRAPSTTSPMAASSSASGPAGSGATTTITATSSGRTGPGRALAEALPLIERLELLIRRRCAGCRSSSPARASGSRYGSSRSTPTPGTPPSRSARRAGVEGRRARPLVCRDRP